jgi:hypothetical protein
MNDKRKKKRYPDQAMALRAVVPCLGSKDYPKGSWIAPQDNPGHILEICL